MNFPCRSPFLWKDYLVHCALPILCHDHLVVQVNTTRQINSLEMWFSPGFIYFRLFQMVNVQLISYYSLSHLRFRGTVAFSALSGF